MKNLLLFLLVMITLPLFSQKIYITGEKCKAEFDIIYTRHKWQADICMKTVAYEYQAGRSRTRNGCDNWFIVENIWQADYVIRVVNSKHPGRETLYVYRDNEGGYVPPLRDRNDPRNQYHIEDSGYTEDDDVYNGSTNSKIKIIIEPTIIFRYRHN